MPLGLRLLIAGIGMMIVSSAFAGLGLPGLSDLMGLFIFIGFWMAAGGFVILVAPALFFLSRGFSARWAERSRTVKGRFPASHDAYWASRPVGGEVTLTLQDPRPSWTLILLQALDWKVFEELCSSYLRETGFRSEVTPLGADGGVDIWVYSKTQDKRVAAVQCKAWNAWQVGVKPVRELYGVMAGTDIRHGIFVTTGDFTEEARRFAVGKSLKLINGGDFLAKIKGLSNEAQQRLFREATTGAYATPSCPKCGEKLVRRNSSAGEFWGCPSFPRCRGKLRAAKATAEKH